MIDALELPVEHLASPEHLTQAVNITDAALLVYDITDLASLTYLKSLSSTLHDALHAKAPTPTRKRTNAFSFSSSSSRQTITASPPSAPARPYHFLLLGAKNDVPSSRAREVSWLEGHSAAGEFFGPAGVAGGASAGFVEVSARSGENVAAVFPLLGLEVIRSRREKREAEAEAEMAPRQQMLGRRGAEGGAFGAGWACSGFDFDGDDDIDDTSGGNADKCECAGSAGTLRRRWCALKTSFSGSIFRKETGK